MGMEEYVHKFERGHFSVMYFITVIYLTFGSLCIVLACSHGFIHHMRHPVPTTHCGKSFTAYLLPFVCFNTSPCLAPASSLPSFLSIILKCVQWKQSSISGTRSLPKQSG